MHQDEAFPYGATGWSPEDPKQIIITRVPANSRVLDIGCGNGLLGEWLKQNKNCSVVGVEGHPKGFRQAQTRLDQVLQVDLNDTQTLKRSLQRLERFDVITGIDVLEHCYQPQAILKIMADRINPSGQLIVSIPNVAHHSVRFGLLRGRWEYQDTGILDRTHVAFYTKQTAMELVQKGGFRIKEVLHTSPQGGYWRLIDRIDPGLTAVQFIIIAQR